MPTFARMTGSRRCRTHIACRGGASEQQSGAATPRRCNLESRRPPARHGTPGSPRLRSPPRARQRTRGITQAGPARSGGLRPEIRQLRGPRPHRHAARRDGRCETPAFLRRRVRAVACGPRDPRPRFRAARRLVAQYGPALHVAKLAHLTVDELRAGQGVRPARLLSRESRAASTSDRPLCAPRFAGVARLSFARPTHLLRAGRASLPPFAASRPASER